MVTNSASHKGDYALYRACIDDDDDKDYPIMFCTISFISFHCGSSSQLHALFCLVISNHCNVQ